MEDARPDPASPEFVDWVKQTLDFPDSSLGKGVRDGGLVAVLDAVRHALRVYPFPKALVPAVWECISDLQHASVAPPYSPKRGARILVLREAIAQLESIRDRATVIQQRDRDAADGICGALWYAAVVGGMQIDEFVPMEEKRTGARRLAKQQSAKSQHRRALFIDLAKKVLRIHPDLSAKEVAEKVRIAVEKNHPDIYDAMLRSTAKQSPEDRAFNQIYKSIGASRRARTAKQARRRG